MKDEIFLEKGEKETNNKSGIFLTLALYLKTAKSRKFYPTFFYYISFYHNPWSQLLLCCCSYVSEFKLHKTILKNRFSLN